MTRLAYILAASHSGSTVLTMLLNSHPDVATFGEPFTGHPEDLSWYLCSCGSKIRECRFWQWIASIMEKGGHEFHLEDFGTEFRMPESRMATRLLGPLHRGPALEWVRDTGLGLLSRWPNKITEIARANEILVEAVLEYYHARLFVDKGNRALRLKYLLHIPPFDVRVIRLIRDGRGVALTYMDPAGFADADDPTLRGGGNGGKRENERLAMARAAYQWRRCNEEAEHALRRLDKSQWIEVRYEDLCGDTESTLARLFEFLNLDPAKRIRDFCTVEHHVLGNGMRLNATSRVSLDERWRSALTDDELHCFERVAGPLNRRYGYQ